MYIRQQHGGNSVGIATNWMDIEAFGINSVHSTIKHAIPAFIHIYWRTVAITKDIVSCGSFISIRTVAFVAQGIYLLRSAAEEHNIANSEGFGERYLFLRN